MPPTPSPALDPTLSARDPLLPHSRVTTISVERTVERTADLIGPDARALYSRVALGLGTASVLELAADTDMPVGVIKHLVHRLRAAGLVRVAPTVEPNTRAAQRVLTHLAIPTTPVVSVAPTAVSARIVVTGSQAAKVLHALGDVEIVHWLMPAPQERPDTTTTSQGHAVVQHQTWFTVVPVSSDVVVYVTADHPPCDISDHALLRDTIALILTLDPDAPQACASLVEQCRRAGVPVVAAATGDAREADLAHTLGVELIAPEDLWGAVAPPRVGAW